MTLSAYTQAWLTLIPLGPSLIVTIFILYHLLKVRALRHALNNHVIILLLCCGLIEQVTDLMWQSYLFFTGIALSPTIGFCYVWAFIGTAVFVSSFILMAWASIERHILVFYPRVFATRTKRLLFHYFPLAVCIIWPSVFYVTGLFIVPCAYPLNTKRIYCNQYGCIVGNPLLSLMDSVANYIMPAFVTVLFSVALFSRVLLHRYRIRGRIDWRNYKKMTLQLFPVSFLYLVLQLPPMVLYAAYSAGVPFSVGGSYYIDSAFFMNWVVQLTPFACLVSVPELGTKCRKLVFFWRRRNAVQPAALAMTRRNVGQTIVPAPSRKTAAAAAVAKAHAVPVPEAAQGTATPMEAGVGTLLQVTTAAAVDAGTPTGAKLVITTVPELSAELPRVEV